MSVPYYVHAGSRLRRILKQKKIVIVRYATNAGITPQGLYPYFSQATIKKDKLDELLEAVPLTLEDFYHWNSLETGPWHQGELLLLYLAKQKIKVKQLASRLQLSQYKMQEWLDCARFSQVQLQKLEEQFGPVTEYFNNPDLLVRDVNWEEAYLDKCMEIQHCIRKVHTLEKRIRSLEAR